MLRFYSLFLLFSFFFSTQAQLQVESPIFVCEEDIQPDGSINVLLNSAPVLDGSGNIERDTNSALVLSLTDDSYSPLIPIPFPFEFFGNTYNNCVVSSNGYLSFDASDAGGYSPWSITGALPASNVNQRNAILAPYGDVNPAVGVTTDVFVFTLGAAPNRQFVVSWRNLAMFGCPAGCYNTSVTLFEGSNEIINTVGYITDQCTNWNNGQFVHGVVDATGSANSVFITDPVSGVVRNWPNLWETSNESVRYTPNGNSYTYAFIPFASYNAPVWYDAAGMIVGNGYNPSITLSSPSDLPATFTAVIDNCGELFSVDVLVEYGVVNHNTQIIGETCIGENDGKILYDVSGGENEDWDISLLDDSGVLESFTGVDNTPVVFTDLTSTLYRIAVSSPTTCTDTIEVLLGLRFEQAQFHVNIDRLSCQGADDGVIVFYPRGGYEPEWDVDVYQDGNPNPIRSFQGVTDDSVVVDDLPIGEYYFEVNSPTTCPVTSGLYLVEEPEPLAIQAEFIGAECENLFGTLQAFPTGGNAPYRNFLNDEEVIAWDRDFISPGDYTLRVEDSKGCSFEEEVLIRDLHSPRLELSISQDELYLYEHVLKASVSIDLNEYTSLQNIEWHMGDGTTYSGEASVEHTYSDIGPYEVYVTVTDELCQTQIHKTVNVVTPVMVLPNIFTPNGDGNNDIFKPVFTRISPQDFSLKVYNRWGEEVFSSEDIEEGWAGFDKEGIEVEGNFIWIARFRDTYGADYKEEGTVVLTK